MDTSLELPVNRWKQDNGLLQ